MAIPARPFVVRLAGAAAASGLALAGLVAAAWPASAAACSGSTGVTVVVDTGGSISTKCASGNPDSAWAALEAAGYGVTPVASQPGAICKINAYPDTACQRMPPASAYWAFFHAKRGGGWIYSSTGARSFDPPSGSVVGFRFGSGQQPGIAPPAAAKTSTPTPTKTTSKPKPTTSAPKATTPKATTPKATSGSAAVAGSTSPAATVKGQASATPSASATASASASPSPSASDTASASPSETASDLASAPTSADADDGGGPGTLVAGGALVALVAGGAGWAAWKRRA